MFHFQVLKNADELAGSTNPKGFCKEVSVLEPNATEFTQMIAQPNR